MRNKTAAFCFCLLLLLTTNLSFAAFTVKNAKGADSVASKPPVDTVIQKGMEEFSHLSNREKRSRFKEMKKAIKEFRAQKKDESDVSTNTLLLILIAIFIPPLAVYIHEGDINNRFWISVLLTVLGYVLFGFAGIFFLGSLPGIIYALYVILSGT